MNLISSLFRDHPDGGMSRLKGQRRSQNQFNFLLLIGLEG
jgi:hypothetical protein